MKTVIIVAARIASRDMHKHNKELTKLGYEMKYLVGLQYIRENMLDDFDARTLYGGHNKINK